MKFTSIRLSNTINRIDLPIVNARSSDPYILKSADGLGPPEINIFIAASRNMDGYYKGRETQYREIVLNVGLNPNHKANIMVSDLRSELYGLLSAGESDSLDLTIIYDGTELMYTNGYIKKFEIVPFSSDPEVQIIIASNKSCFQGFSDVYVDMRSEEGWQDIVNEGTAETGIVFQVTFTESHPFFILTDARGNSMILNYRFDVDDTLTINTCPGSRSIELLDSKGHPKNLIYALTLESKWLWLYGGVNRLSFYAGVFTWDEFYYKPQYWGI
jgi:hypothetical protein